MTVVRKAMIVTAVAGCVATAPGTRQAPPLPLTYPRPIAPGADPGSWGVPVHVVDDFAFDGGQLHFELRRLGSAVIQTVRNDYLAPVTMAWTVTNLANLAPLGPAAGIVVLPPATAPGGRGLTVTLTTFEVPAVDATYFRYFDFRARFGDPAVRPRPYAYALPFGVGQTWRLLQGFHGAFSHRGSNEYAVDFACPEGTPVLAAREGLVIATHAVAQGNGTRPELMDYAHTNFLVVLHDDGTLGEYMHLAPGGVRVRAGQRVRRSQYIALSGNTGFSTTPHLHFQVMTAAANGRDARSFPFEIQIAPGRSETPTVGRPYRAYERAAAAGD